MKNRAVVIFLTSFLMLIPSLEARVLTLAESINQSGLQRMLSQRITKNYLSIAHRINLLDASKEMDECVAQFEENLSDLSDSIVDKNSKEAMKALKLSWFEFRKLILVKPSEENTIKVLESNTDLLNKAHQLVVSLENFANQSSAKLINISGRQRMLSQRISLYYLAGYAGYRGEVEQRRLAEAVNDFSQGLDTLLKATENTPLIQSDLQDVSDQWNFYKSRFDNLGKERYVPRVIRVIMDRILRDMDQITKQYESLLTSKSAS